MIRNYIRIVCAFVVGMGYAYMDAQSIQMPPQFRSAFPEMTSILESPDTTVQQKLGQLIALPLIQVKGRGPTARAFATALVTLLNNGAQLDEVISNDGTTRFHMLVASPNFDSGAAKAFFAYAKPILGENYINSLLSTPNAGGQTPLFFAAEKNADLLSLLLDDYRASAQTLNMQTEGGKSPLFKAAEVGNEQSVKALLRRNANITLRDKFGYTAYDIAVKNGKNNVANTIYDHARRKNISNFATKYEPEWIEYGKTLKPLN